MCRKPLLLISFVLVLCSFGNVWGLVWAQKDIGNPGIPGSADYNSVDDIWTIKGSGHDIWATRDGFYYVFRPLSGDGTLEVNLASMTIPDYWTKVGVMVRETSDASSKHALLAMSGHDEWEFNGRLTTGGGTGRGTPSDGELPQKLKITRTGDLLQGYAWDVILPIYIKIGEVAIPMNTDVLIGLAVCSHDNSVLCTAVLDNVILTAPPYEKAWDLSPADGATVSLTPTLSWLPGDSATSHDVYFGTDYNDVNDANTTVPLGVYAGNQSLEANSYDPCGLELATTYYWRVDEVNDACVWQGDVWRFTAMPAEVGTIREDLWWNITGTAVSDLTSDPRFPDSPSETRWLTSFNSGGGLDRYYGGMIHGWLHPAKSGNYTFWLCTDNGGELWLSSDENPANMSRIADITDHASELQWWDPEEPNQQSASIPLLSGQKYYIRALWKEHTGGDHCQVAWQGPDQPLAPVDGNDDAVIPGTRLSPSVQLWAHHPDPRDGQAKVPTSYTLRWGPGEHADKHDVYIGTDEAAVGDANVTTPDIYKGRFDPNTYPVVLDVNQLYYWRIDEVNLAGPDPCMWKGGVWCFTTVVDEIFVDIAATGGNNGTSWADAYKYLQDGLADAEAVGLPTAVYVAEGIYVPDANLGIPDGTGDPNAVFGLISGVALYGGFPTGGGDWESRDPNSYETILSGDLDADDTQGLDPCDLFDDPNRGENSFHVVTGSGTDDTAILDGFTITGGHARGKISAQEPNDFGGGMYNDAGSPTVLNCIFTGNSARKGGGMYNVVNSDPTVTNCTFSGNYSDSLGGGMSNYGNANLTNCTFIGNLATESGGGMSNHGNANLTNCTFSGNSAYVSGGGMRNYGDPNLTNCTFSGNYSDSLGGGIFNFGNPNLTNCTFSGNSATDTGGGLHGRHGSTTLTNCIFWGNTASNGAQIALIEIIPYSPTVTVSYSDVQGGEGGVYVDTGCTLNWGSGNINSDPCFVDANGPDDTFGTDDDNLRLSPDSPCIDAGDSIALPGGVTTDLDGNSRFINDPFTYDTGYGTPPIVDMGPYEYDRQIKIIIYVDRSVFGGFNNGTSWANAFTDLQDGLDIAVAGDQIWVAQGIYHPTVEVGGTGDRYQTFQMKNGVEIYGGFSGRGSPDWDGRDPSAYETILSGDIGTPGDDSDNCYHVFYHSATNLEPNAVLDGFTITAGNADGSGSGAAGGGMYNSGSGPTVTNCTFTGNSADNGGGMVNGKNSNTDVTNCQFNGNRADYGGGIYNDSSNPTVTNCTFSGNSATDDGGGMYNYDSNSTVTNCTFSGNSANRIGGYGGGMYNENSDPTLTNCIFWGNTAPALNGPQIYDDATSSATVTYSDVQGDGSGTGNIDADPLFVDPNGPNGQIGTKDDNLRLSPGSPCIDAGDNNAVPADSNDIDGDGNTTEPLPWDLDSRNRFADGDCNDSNVVDMGAYEFAWVYIGDFDAECDVDLVDYAFLALTWLLEDGDIGYNPDCDISIPADNKIDWADGKILCDNWLAGK